MEESDGIDGLAVTASSEIEVWPRTQHPASLTYLYQFPCDKSGQGSNEIRLIRIYQKKLDVDQIKCDIFHVSLDNTPPYKALSYSWGDPLDASFLIHLNGFIFCLKESMRSLISTGSRFPGVDHLDRRYMYRPEQHCWTKRAGQQDGKTSMRLQIKSPLGWGLPAMIAIPLSNGCESCTLGDTPWGRIMGLCKQPRSMKCMNALASVISRPYWTRI